MSDQVLKTPVLKVSNAHLKAGLTFDGKTRHQVTVMVDPTRSEHAAKFLQFINQEIAKAVGDGQPSWAVVKPRKTKNPETGAYDLLHSTEKEITFKAELPKKAKSSLQPFVQEGYLNEDGRKLVGDELNLPFGTAVQIGYKVKEIDFEKKVGTDKDGNPVVEQIKGITLTLVSVGVIERPEQKRKTSAPASVPTTKVDF